MQFVKIPSGSYLNLSEISHFDVTGSGASTAVSLVMSSGQVFSLSGKTASDLVSIVESGNIGTGLVRLP